MFNEEIFNFNIDNIKNDLAIEGMETQMLIYIDNLQMKKLICQS